MKHWKRNANQPPGSAKMPGSRNVLLRFYPPQTTLGESHLSEYNTALPAYELYKE